MSNTIDFYFDIMSPFSYLAHTQLPDLARKYGYQIAYHPIDIPQAKIAAGNYGPSNREIPAKIKVLIADLERWAKRYNVPFNFPESLEVELWNVGVFYAIEKDQTEEYVDECYRKVWGMGIDPTNLRELKDTAKTMGWDQEKFLDYVQSSKARTEFRKACVEAQNKGVFGAPIMMLDDQVWWGNDRLDFIEEYLSKL